MPLFKHVLVTGGAGFIGSQLVRALLKKSEHITIVDDLTTGNRDEISDSPNITFIEDSILNEKLLEDILPDIDVVFHIACRNLVLSVTDMHEDFEVNLRGAYTLLDQIRKHGKQIKRFVYTSTASVYGDATILPTPLKEINIRMPYAASKYGAEQYAHVFYHLHQIPVTILRLSNVYGPGQVATNPYCGVVAKFFEARHAGLPMTIFGDGSQTRDFTFIDDTIEAILLAAQKKEAIGEIFNVATGEETSILELAVEVATVFGDKEPNHLFSTKRTVDTINRRCLAIEKSKQLLLWEPKVKLADGIQRTYTWIIGDKE
ncbi:NAD-dependent epimerase/dehydratase family protein [Alkalicoccobacillus porphyridii]|uniref:NAD-dependent epimerase/dehydratase family protein n=1 Tax=Alkalicoccobacillus porphyridii TaxID=2597270 RepID=A0A553ZXG0_9BACI|nr:NAD-dependent epimerase/dehydratase family protein [Alkalicoccobacillus porphyridii]TSB46085.1 NAD-dependent epimerase/dehydratase family protein [Alkalicoccobacillus porphyridii]